MRVLFSFFFYAVPVNQNAPRFHFSSLPISADGTPENQSKHTQAWGRTSKSRTKTRSVKASVLKPSCGCWRWWYW